MCIKDIIVPIYFFVNVDWILYWITLSICFVHIYEEVKKDLTRGTITIIYRDHNNWMRFNKIPYTYMYIAHSYNTLYNWWNDWHKTGVDQIEYNIVK